MKTLRLRVAAWFAASVAGVMIVFVAAMFFHLQHELRLEKQERGRNAGWTLHGTYSDAEVADIVGELWSLSLRYAAPMLLLAMTAGFFVARRALRPIEDMNHQLQRINAANLHARIDVADADREIHDIGRSINGLLVRLESSFQQLTDYSAQVAHELRTPLTLLRLQIEDSAGRIDPALAESMQEELERLSDYVEQCLLLATAEQGRLAVRRERVDLAALVRDVLEAYALLAREAQRTIRSGIANAVVETDPRYARQLLHILLSNALRHGEGDISVNVRDEAGGSVCCEIVNRIKPHGAEPLGHGVGLRLGKALAVALGVEWEISSGAEPVFRGALRFAPATLAVAPVAG